MIANQKKSKTLKLTVKRLLNYAKKEAEKWHPEHTPYHYLMPREIESDILAWNENLWFLKDLIIFLEGQPPEKVIRHIRPNHSIYEFAKGKCFE